jgi:hypothetical protein
MVFRAPVFGWPSWVFWLRCQCCRVGMAENARHPPPFTFSAVAAGALLVDLGLWDAGGELLWASTSTLWMRPPPEDRLPAAAGPSGAAVSWATQAEVSATVNGPRAQLTDRG